MKTSHSEQLQNIPFPVKLHQLLDEMEETGQTDVISWRKNGKPGFKIHDRKKFAQDIMPKFFGSNKLKSFQRSLNLWGFTSGKRIDERGIYCHQDFHRGKPEMCYTMRRAKIKGNTDDAEAVAPEAPQEKKIKKKKETSSTRAKRQEKEEAEEERENRSNFSSSSASSSGSSSRSSTKKIKRYRRNDTQEEEDEGMNKNRKTSSSPQLLDPNPAADTNNHIRNYASPSSSAAIIQELRRAQQQHPQGNTAGAEAVQSHFSPFTASAGLFATHPQLESTLLTSAVAPSLGTSSPFASLLAAPPMAAALPSAVTAPQSSSSLDSTINNAAAALKVYILSQQLQQQQQQQQLQPQEILPSDELSSSAPLQALLVQQAQQAAATAAAAARPNPSPPAALSQVDIINTLLREQYASYVAASAAASAANKEQQQQHQQYQQHQQLSNLVHLLQFSAATNTANFLS